MSAFTACEHGRAVFNGCVECIDKLVRDLEASREEAARLRTRLDWHVRDCCGGWDENQKETTHCLDCLEDIKALGKSE